jgi:uncharacterized protein (DUF849 family)
MADQDKAIITCALTGVLTNPEQHPVPVTVEEMAASAKEAFDAGASIMHVHFRKQEPGQGHLPTWDPDVVEAILNAIRGSCPGVIINMSTGVHGDDVSKPEGCLRRCEPEIAACNAGSLNYLKLRKDGSWAWTPRVFVNGVDKVQKMLDIMADTNTSPEFECFDLGIVRSVGLYADNGMVKDPRYNFVTGVASGMPTDPELLPLLIRYAKPNARWQVTAIGRQEVWPMHQRAAELGGALRSGLEDTFYMPSGERARGNGDLMEAMVQCVRNAGREVASPAESRTMLNLKTVS